MFHPNGPSFFELVEQALSSTERGYDLLAPKFDYTVLYIYSADRHCESTNDARIDLRSGAMVETKHPTEPLDAFNGGPCRFGTVTRLDQSIIDPLVISLPMIMSGVLASGLSKRPLAEEDHSIETFILD